MCYRCLRIKVASYILLLALYLLAENVYVAGIAPLSWAGLAVLGPPVIGLALLGGWLSSPSSHAARVADQAPLLVPKHQRSDRQR